MLSFPFLVPLLIAATINCCDSFLILFSPLFPVLGLRVLVLAIIFFLPFDSSFPIPSVVLRTPFGICLCH